MRTFLRAYKSILHGIALVERSIGILLLVGVVVFIFIQVVSRYVLGSPLVWVEELSTYFFIWGVFIGAAYALIRGRHIVVTTVTDFFPKPVRRLLGLMADALLLFFLGFAFWYGIRQFELELPQHTIALPLRLPRVIFYSVPFIISVASMALTSLYFLLCNLYEMITGIDLKEPHGSETQVATKDY